MQKNDEMGKGNADNKKELSQTELDEKKEDRSLDGQKEEIVDVHVEEEGKV